MTEPSETRITVAIVDDHPLVRAGLRSVLEAAGDITVVAEASDGDEVPAMVATHAPAIVLMDLSMARVGGVEATRLLRASAADTRVIVLSSYSDRARVEQALAAGAVGYLLKDSEPAELLAGVRSAGRGHVPIDPRVAGVLLPTSDADATAEISVSGLSQREREVLAEVAHGYANKQIARRLGITEGTVKAHLGNIYRQIGVLDRTSAALWARDHGIAT